MIMMSQSWKEFTNSRVTRYDYQGIGKLSFEFKGKEMIKNGCHTAYYNKQYDIMVIVEEKWIRKGLRISRIFKYNGKQYRKIERFLEVIKDVEFVP